MDTSNTIEPWSHLQVGSITLLNRATLGPSDKITLIPQKGLSYKEYGAECMWNYCILYRPYNMQKPTHKDTYIILVDK